MSDSHVMTAEPDARERAGPSEATTPADSRWNLVLFAVWLGLLVWAAEYTVLSFRKFFLFEKWIWFRESVWLAALMYAVAFALLGLVSAAIARSPRRRRLAFVVLSGSAIFAALLVFKGVHALAWLVLSVGIGYQLGTVLAARESAVFRLVRRTLPVFAGATTLIVGALIAAPLIRERAAYAALPAADPDSPNVILLILDTVRARDLGLYGHERPNTPRLREFARSGVTFDRAIATSPWTLPSHYSILTGLYPHEMPFFLEFMPDPSLGASGQPLPEVLGRRGYAAAGFIANLMYATEETGLDRGFIRWEDHTPSLGQAAISTAPGRALLRSARLRRLLDWHDIPIRKSAARINGAMLDWIDDHRDRPFFVLANYYDAHVPYLSPPEFSTRFVSREPTAELQYHAVDVGWKEKRGYSAGEYEAHRDAYNAAIAWLDSELGHLFDALESRDLMDNTLILITSDHGEQFGEHGTLGHRVGQLYMELLRVPLVIRFDGRTPEGLRIDRPVTLADLPATVLDLVNVRQHPIPGESLASTWEDGAGGPYSPRLSQFNPGQSRSGILLDGWHYIRANDGTEELYHTRVDSLELHDRAGEPSATQRVLLMRAALDSAMAIPPDERGGE
jgi:arylsulfatase A-like enzyme